MNYVYVLKSELDERLYIGLTNNLVKRYEEHNSGKARSTKGRRPLQLIYFEEIEKRSEAALREKHLKSGRGREELKGMLIEKVLPKWRNW
jgi:putative endonuclease